MRNSQQQADLILSLVFDHIEGGADSARILARKRRRLLQMARRSLYPVVPAPRQVVAEA